MEMKGDATARQLFIGSHPVYTAADFNPSQLARWTWDEQVFSFMHEGQDYYPAFQFGSDQQPLPVMQKVLPLLASRLTNWQIALWYTEQNPNLDGRRPIDLLVSNPEEIWLAARSEARKAPKT